MFRIGTALARLALALVGLAEFIAPDDVQSVIVYWLLGSFVGATTHQVYLIAVPTLCAGAVLMLLRWRLNLLSLGDLDAGFLDINVARLRWVVVALVSMVVAAQVSVSGIVGWAGFVVPHVARILVGPDHRRLLPASALVGGWFVQGLDHLTRSIVRAEIPVGVLTALIGTPVNG